MRKQSFEVDQPVTHNKVLGYILKLNDTHAKIQFDGYTATVLRSELKATVRQPLWTI